MVALLGDGLQALFPSVDFVSSRLYCFFLMAPFLFFPLRKLSVASFIGIVSCVSLVIIVLFDGFSKNDKPGSLWDPMVGSVDISRHTHTERERYNKEGKTTSNNK